MELDEIWNYLVETGITTQEELELITCINGYNEETLNDVIFARTGVRDIESLKEEYGC